MLEKSQLLKELDKNISELIRESSSELLTRINDETSVKDLLAILTTGMKVSEQITALRDAEEDSPEPSSGTYKLSSSAQKYLASRNPKSML
jgi:hypothetical protein